MQPRSTVQTSERPPAFGPHAKPVRRRAPHKPALISARAAGYRFEETFFPIYYGDSNHAELAHFSWMCRVHWAGWSICADYCGAWHCDRAVVDDFGNLVVVGGVV